MLPCECQPHTPLSRDEFARLLPLVLDDYVPVMRFAVRTFPPTSTMLQFYESVRTYDFPPLAILNTVVGFVLNEFYWLAKRRPLTTDEQHIHAAAWRLSDAMHGPRDTN